MAIYLNEETGVTIEAECFEIYNIDNFMNFVSRSCNSITLHGWDFAEIHFPFGYLKHMVVCKGDYVVKGNPIPNTIPEIYELIHIKKYCFNEQYKIQKQGVNATVVK